MRGSVIAVAGALVVIAAGLLWLDRGGGPAERAAVPHPVAPVDAPPRPVAVPAPSIARAPDLPPAPPRAAINRFLADDRLLDLYESLRQSKAGGDLFVAKRIEQDCYFDTRTTFTVGSVLAGRKIQRFDRIPVGSVEAPEGGLAVVEVVPTREQVAAARELFRRCEGFDARTAADHRTDRLALETQLLRSDDAVGIAESIAVHRVPPTLDRLRTILASQDPIAISLLDDELTARWQRTSVQPMPTSLFGTTSPVMQLVGCDLGIDCSPTSRTALVGCLDQASACGLDVHGQLLRGESPAARQSIDELRTRFVDAITGGDFTIWGL